MILPKQKQFPMFEQSVCVVLNLGNNMTANSLTMQRARVSSGIVNKLS